MIAVSLQPAFIQPPGIKFDALANPAAPVGFGESLSTALTQNAQFEVPPSPQNYTIPSAARLIEIADINARHKIKDDAELAAIDAKLAEIKAKDTRTAADIEYLHKYDTKLIEIMAKEYQHPNMLTLTSSEIDYEQKAGGFINWMAHLNVDEKNMFDSLVSSGNQDAVKAISDIALLRAEGHVAGGANNTVYDPNNTAITSYTVERFFRHSYASETKQTQFQALIQYLQGQHA